MVNFHSTQSLTFSRPLCARTVQPRLLSGFVVCLLVCLFVCRLLCWPGMLRCCVFLTVSGACGRLDCCTVAPRVESGGSKVAGEQKSRGAAASEARRTNEQINKQSPGPKLLWAGPYPNAQYAKERVMRLSAFPNSHSPLFFFQCTAVLEIVADLKDNFGVKIKKLIF